EDVNPALGTLGLHAEEKCRDHQNKGTDQHQEREATHLARIEERDADHDADGRKHKDDLSCDEVEAFQANALGHGRTCREGEHNAQSHQHQKCREEPAVNRPPPGGDAACIGPADHWFVPPIGSTPSRARTISRNASPRTSKFLNWSKLAQAGERRTTGSACVASLASRLACSTAAAIVPEIS